ncbi:IS3 family transposase [Bacillus thuringiensis]|uniref:IS3 family transposase n=6 Tax=Bacillus thuringiensis TaxID=1428 RepID=UPI000B44DD79|nr:IS3 family transposase [Bacillus thuringiensis]MEC2879602.1 IS3 family transposase [Bacillus cereus]MCR6834411.1 IS3 family transposase [Bacillus thuringiensis]MCR6835107.1 IS3 family transposase [Bacillus thuringiensis]MCR6835221.1 IS3 family transposase [Bacillus thuringiensis]MDY7954906.1 IS3 family transposase [Bacillus thuringiensis]
MAKFTADEKIQIVLRYLNGNESYREIGRSLGINDTIILNWVNQYKQNGLEAFLKRCTNYTQQFKLDVLNFMIENGMSLFETAAIFNIPAPSTISVWKKQLETQGIDALQSKKKGRPSMKKDSNKQLKQPLAEGSVEALEARIKQLEMENEYFKKVKCLSSKQGKITKQDKAQVVYELRHKYSVKALVELATIPRSTYYDLVKKMNRPDLDADLKAEIKAIYEENEGRYGYRRIRDELTNRGQKVNHKKVQRIMKELGLKCVVRMKKYKSYKGKVGRIAPNILERNFYTDAPNQKWVTDITEFKLFGEKLYVSPVLDLYNGEIITYTIGSRPTYSLVSDMLEKALERLPETHQLLMHSDQGWHYQMRQYVGTLESRAIVQSMSRKGNCYDNAVIENFFGIMKSEFLYIKEFENVEHFKIELEKYIDYYNTKRIKAKLKMSPVQYRTHFYQAA